MGNSNLKKFKSLKKILGFGLLVVFSSGCGSSSDTSLSSNDKSNCRAYVLNVDTLNSLAESFSPETNYSLAELELQLFLSPTSQKLDVWDNLFGNLYLNLNRFGIPENEELSDLVFATQRQYVKARIVFTTTKTYGEIEPAFNSYISAANKLWTFCGGDA